MKIKFQNLAHIAGGELESSKLTILMGDNGSGKTLLLETYSYIAELYNKKLKEIVANVVKENFSNISITVDIEQLNKTLSDFYLNEDKWDRNVFRRDLNYVINFSDPKLITKNIQSELIEYKNLVTEKIKKNILNNSSMDFSFSLIDLPEIHDNINENKLNLYMLERETLYLSQVNEIIEVDLSVFLKDDYLKLFNNNILLPQNIKIEMIDLTKFIQRYQYEIVIDFIYDIYYKYFLKGDVLYFPSERNSDYLELLFKTLGPEKFKKIVRYSEQNYHDFMSKQRSIDRLSSNDTIFNAELIKLIGGIPNYNEDGEIVSLKVGNIDVQKKMFSTKMIRTIPYTFLGLSSFRFKTVVLEEPEAHLSLKSMDDLIMFFKKVNIFRDIVVTTHSDVFYQKLINLIMKNNFYSNKINVYELLKKDGMVILKKCEKNEYGFEVEFFQDALERHYLDTINALDGDKNDN